MIQRVLLQNDFGKLVQLLNNSFGTVARDFRLTKENCPTNSAFITSEELKSQLTENREFYTFNNGIVPVGFIAIERSLEDPGTFYIEKVAVQPDFRHEGIGKKLMSFAERRIEEIGGSRISLGLIDSNTLLKKWYIEQGYTIITMKTYDHLPFNVCFMGKVIKMKNLITLRKWCDSDLESLAKYADNYEIARFLTDAFPYPYTVEDAKAYILMVKDENPVKCFAIDLNGEAIGSIGIFPQADVHRKNAEMGYWLAEEFWGQGIMPEAIGQIVDYGFRTFDITRIFARPYGHNLKSQRVLVKAGFVLEARFEKALFKHGEFVDELIYAIRKK